MTRRRNLDEHMARVAEAVVAQMARHEARMSEAFRTRERAMEGAKLRRAEAMRSRERAMEAVERRVEEVLRRSRAQRSGLPPADFFNRRRGGRRPGEEGGDPMPAVPRPKPRPLAGAAAAAIE